MSCESNAEEPVGLLFNFGETKVEVSCHPVKKSVARLSYFIAFLRPWTSAVAASQYTFPRW